MHRQARCHRRCPALELLAGSRPCPAMQGGEGVDPAAAAAAAGAAPPDAAALAAAEAAVAEQGALVRCAWEPSVGPSGCVGRQTFWPRAAKGCVSRPCSCAAPCPVGLPRPCVTHPSPANCLCTHTRVRKTSIIHVFR